MVDLRGRSHYRWSGFGGEDGRHQGPLLFFDGFDVVNEFYVLETDMEVEDLVGEWQRG